MGHEEGEVLDLDPEITVPSSPSLISTDDMASSDTPSEHDAELPAPCKKKKKTTHISADKALILGGGPQSAGPSSSTSRATRQKNEVNYARVKRKYTKK